MIHNLPTPLDLSAFQFPHWLTQAPSQQGPPRVLPADPMPPEQLLSCLPPRQSAQHPPFTALPCHLRASPVHCPSPVATTAQTHHCLENPWVVPVSVCRSQVPVIACRSSGAAGQKRSERNLPWQNKGNRSEVVTVECVKERSQKPQRCYCSWLRMWKGSGET